MAVKAMIESEKNSYLKFVRDYEDINIEFGDVLISYFDSEGTLILCEQFDEADANTLKAAGFNLVKVEDLNGGYTLKVA